MLALCELPARKGVHGWRFRAGSLEPQPFSCPSDTLFVYSVFRSLLKTGKPLYSAAVSSKEHVARKDTVVAVIRNSDSLESGVGRDSGEKRC